MLGLIQDRPFLLSDAVAYAARYHASTAVISRQRDGTFLRSNWRETDRRVRRLASALRQRGFGIGDRIATLSWNNHRHLELYFAISAIGAICHPINPRLFPEQAIYIADHAEDTALFFDLEYAQLAQSIAAACPRISLFVHLEDERTRPDIGRKTAMGYEELLQEGDDKFEYPQFDERTAASLCYTSGTTGNPKGVLSSHRALVVHALAARSADIFALPPQSVACCIVPLYHAHASWGLPFAAAMSGSALVLPGLALDGHGLIETFSETATTVANGVPTIWYNVASGLKDQPANFKLGRIVVAGSAPSPDLVGRLEQAGVSVCHLWGMTETGPCGTSGALPAWTSGLPDEQVRSLQSKQGHGMFGVEMRIEDENGRALEWGEQNIGRLKVRGPYVISGYFKGEGKGAVDSEGWFDTGDVAIIDAHGYMKLLDRAKDLLKSGGEWISSIDVENAAMSHPAVREAAVIGIPHDIWGERPLLLVVPNEGYEYDEVSIRTHLADRIAKWWLPEKVELVASLPRTGTGKVMKGELRRMYGVARTDSPVRIDAA